MHNAMVANVTYSNKVHLLVTLEQKTVPLLADFTKNLVEDS